MYIYNEKNLLFTRSVCALSTHNVYNLLFYGITCIFMGSHWEENVVNLDNIANARHTNGLDMKIVRSR
jgi:hypothetical protein